MPKDLKTGMAIGLLLTAFAVIWLATRPSLSTKARILQKQNTNNHPQTLEEKSDSVSDSPANKITAHVTEKPEISAWQRLHIVTKGETLSSISYKHYGTANRWKEILEANRNKIKNPEKLKPGIKLTIPE